MRHRPLFPHQTKSQAAPGKADASMVILTPNQSETLPPGHVYTAKITFLNCQKLHVMPHQVDAAKGAAR